MRQSRPAAFKGRHFQEEVILLCVRWYLRYSLSYRDLEEMMAERSLSVDHSTIARWVLRYAPLLHQRVRRHLHHPNRSWRVDETYVRVAGRWTYLYRNRTAAKHFLQLALWRVGYVRPRVINVDGHPAYPSVIAELKRTGELSHTCQYRRSPYKNNMIEQDHRFIKKRIVASQWFRSVKGALHTIQGYGAMHMIRKGQIRWGKKGDIAEQVRFVNPIFGLAA